MTTFQAILFILSCFTFMLATFHVFAAATTAICATIAKVNVPTGGGWASVIAALSFTYIMSYLFIW